MFLIQIPIVKQKVSGGALTCLSWEKSGVNLAVGTSYSDDAPASVKVFNVSDVSHFGSFSLLLELMVFLTFLTFHSGHRLMSLNGHDLRRRSTHCRGLTMLGSERAHIIHSKIWIKIVKKKELFISKFFRHKKRITTSPDWKWKKKRKTRKRKTSMIRTRLWASPSPTWRGIGGCVCAAACAWVVCCDFGCPK